MMRIILATIAFVMLATPSWGYSNGELLQRCKLFANNAFKFDGLDQEDALASSHCLTYIVGQMDAGKNLCNSIDILINENISQNPNEAATVAKIFGNSADRSQTFAVIQSFINYAEANPRSWEFIVSPQSWLAKDYPCDLSIY